MALRTTLNEIVEMVRDEARLSSNTSRGSDHRANIVRLIKRHYQVLADSYDWQHLELKRAEAVKQVAGNQRYYDFPLNLNTDKIEKAYYLNGSTWEELGYGISLEDYNGKDSDNGETSNIILKWDYYGDGQFEVWPMPASSVGTICFIGQKKITPLTDDDARADIDDILLSLVVSAEILAGNEQQAAAQVKADAARTRLTQMRAGKASKTRVRIGLGCVDNARKPRSIDYVR